MNRDELRRVQARDMTEVPQLTDTIIGMAHDLGWLVHHDRPARTVDGWRTAVQGDAGFPDLLMIHPKTGAVLCMELKREGKQPTEPQEVWLAAFAKSPIRSGVWRPSDLLSGAVGEALIAGAKQVVDLAARFKGE